jgi:hypothetical protein
MAYQRTKTEARRTKKEPGWPRVPGVKKASKKARRLGAARESRGDR